MSDDRNVNNLCTVGKQLFDYTVDIISCDPGDAKLVSSQAEASHSEENNKPVEQCDIEQVVFSPSIRYAGCHSYTARYE